MSVRSWLFVPGDNDRKLAKAEGSGADALVLDLEDSVAEQNRPEARRKVRQFLDARAPGGRRCQLWVRVNSLDDGTLLDLAAVVGGAPDGIMLPKIQSTDDIARVAHALDALEVREGLAAGHVKMTAVATETPAAVLKLFQFAERQPARLIGLNWGAEDLSAAIGASTNLDVSGQWALTYRWARSAVLLAAKAAGVQAIDTVYVNYKDTEACARRAAPRRRKASTAASRSTPTRSGQSTKLSRPRRRTWRWPSASWRPSTRPAASGRWALTARCSTSRTSSARAMSWRCTGFTAAGRPAERVRVH
jgi:citrate lyase subunit beta/citryl-CoA lyase